jgi:hypothetical protein
LTIALCSRPFGGREAVVPEFVLSSRPTFLDLRGPRRGLSRWTSAASRERECDGGLAAWLRRGGDDVSGSGRDAEDAEEARERLQRAARAGDCERLASGFQRAGGFPPATPR